MKKIFYSVLFISTFIFSSCVGDLDQFPHKETTSADVYAEAANYKAVLGKLYVSFVRQTSYCRTGKRRWQC